MAAPNSYKDQFWSNLGSSVEQKLNLPQGLLNNILSKGERSNADQVSSAGARTPFQIIPETRNAVLKKYGIDAYLNPENAAEAAGLLLQESLKRNDGDVRAAVSEYHGGTNRKNWGPVTNAYVDRVVNQGFEPQVNRSISDGFAKWLQDNPAVPEKKAAETTKQNPLSAGFGSWLQEQEAAATPAADRIPGAAPGQVAPEAVNPIQPDTPTGIIDTAIGTGEAALSAATGATGGALGMAGGAVKGLTESILDGSFGTPQAANMVEQQAMKGAEALTYQPRTQSGQQQTQALGSAMAQAIPVLPLTGELAAAGAGARAAAPAAKTAAVSATETAAQTAKTAITDLKTPISSVTGRVRAALGRSEEKQNSGNLSAAATDVATQRRARADDLPVPIKLTKGQAERTFEQQQFEREAAKSPDAGAKLREHFEQNNEDILKNFDAFVDESGAVAPSLRVVGSTVDDALVKSLKRDKTEVNVAYAKARKSAESEYPVDQSAPVKIGEGDSAMTSTPLEYINDQPSGLASTGMVDKIKQYAVRLGVADEVDGQLVPKEGATVKSLEDLRQQINKVTGYEPEDIRHATIIKKLIDGQVEPVAGPLYRQARALRTRMAQNYEDRAVINRLLTTKRGSGDRNVALEDVFSHTILDGSLDDVKNVRRVLQRSGDIEKGAGQEALGHQAWNELQGQTVQWLKDEATKNASRDSRGNNVVSFAAINKAVNKLDTDGKLDFIFGKKGAERIRDIRDIAQDVYTSPPGSVNHSNTASIIAATFDLALSSTTGIPAPVASGIRVLVNKSKDRKLAGRIREALDQSEKKTAKF